jgi:hypothetical protein
VLLSPLNLVEVQVGAPDNLRARREAQTPAEAAVAPLGLALDRVVDPELLRRARPFGKVIPSAERAPGVRSAAASTPWISRGGRSTVADEPNAISRQRGPLGLRKRVVNSAAVRTRALTRPASTAAALTSDRVPIKYAPCGDRARRLSSTL